MSNNGLVATTVNPFGDIENQTNCFNSWKRAGYSIRTFNAKKEADVLLTQGFSERDIVILSDCDTTYEKNKKHVPRVQPIIQKLSETGKDIIITNSDIFALHATPLIGVLKSFAPSFGMTRREVLSTSTIDLRDNEYYRGGLDLFFLSAQSAKQLTSELKQCEAANQMAFGIPGWDFLIGALIESRLNGKISDGPIVAHKYHKNTYSGLGNFGPYARDIAKILSLEKSDPNWVAAEYAHRIGENCKINVKISSFLKNFFHANGSNRLSEKNDTSDIKLKDMSNVLNNANAKKLKQVIKKAQSENDWGLANQFTPECFVRTAPLTSKLLTLWNLLITPDRIETTYSTQYPEGNLHGAAVRHYMKLPASQRDIEIFNVFATELINHNIFNKRLFDYLVWSCINPTQVDILARIKACTGDA